MGAAPSSTALEDEEENCACFILSKILPKKNAGDVLGSPLSTPLAEKRKRFNRDDPIMSSKYIGLEKEETPSYHEKNSLRRMETDDELEIYEGADPEKELKSKYEMFEVLGVGSTSTVYRCQNRLTSEIHACKVIDKRHLAEQYTDDENGTIEQFLVEVEVLRELRNHPNIIKLYDVYMNDEKVFMVMELMEGGELFDYVVQKGTLTEEEASEIIRQVTSVVQYMHSKNIIHRDLKPENLLLKNKAGTAQNGGGAKSHKGEIEVKLIDFGLSKCLSPASTTTFSFLGTRGYLAPEMLQRLEYDKSIDTWALGVIAFVLLCGCLPFDDDSQTMTMAEMDRTKRFRLRFPRWASNVSSSAKDFLSKLLHTEPSRRLTAEQAMRHPWVQGETALASSLLASPGRLNKNSPFRKKCNQGPPNPANRMYDPSTLMAPTNNSNTNKRVLVRKKSI
mmetsp:Transcript_25162/g.37183  ORF Transcript_25162/g.37183 Transcript_25162/m.37183 type:complete len:449 (-) Transcript_25162:194-1540(-)|eukprot:CAMPEP_0194216530 /NCGR_PEP_ID=MMETSP0156-20130528/19151_1 /TAXON_ID=33649 /ORGANISM="Thalassionema nitzschioides, Strain L26-B" /LENGTH=448 /DNA_ID=CAMNT_0038945317 /DNA_START=162 /DNA_END=1508 /DNA_ORIENTATION=+